MGGGDGVCLPHKGEINTFNRIGTGSPGGEREAVRLYRRSSCREKELEAVERGHGKKGHREGIPSKGIKTGAMAPMEKNASSSGWRACPIGSAQQGKKIFRPVMRR